MGTASPIVDSSLHPAAAGTANIEIFFTWAVPHVTAKELLAASSKGMLDARTLTAKLGQRMKEDELLVVAPISVQRVTDVDGGVAVRYKVRRVWVCIT
jgi:hypothetical protein